MQLGKTKQYIKQFFHEEWNPLNWSTVKGENLAYKFVCALTGVTVKEMRRKGGESKERAQTNGETGLVYHRRSFARQ